MGHLFYFYHPTEELEGDEIVIEGEEAHHAVKVVRIRPGEKLCFINGKGKKWFCEVSGISSGKLKAKLIKTIKEEQKSKKFTLIFPWLSKDDSIEVLVTMGTEMGIDEFRFYQAERSIRPIKNASKVEKWVIQSCKVTGRSIFPEIKFFKDLESALKDFGGLLLVAVGSENAKPLTSIQILDYCGLIVGPEGDLTEREIEISLEAGAVMVHLGARTLKSETAGLLGSSIILMKQGNFEEFKNDKQIILE